MTSKLKEEFFQQANINGDAAYQDKVWDSAQAINDELRGQGWPDGDHYRAYVQAGANAGDIAEALKFIRKNGPKA